MHENTDTLNDHRFLFEKPLVLTFPRNMETECLARALSDANLTSATTPTEDECSVFLEDEMSLTEECSVLVEDDDATIQSQSSATFPDNTQSSPLQAELCTRSRDAKVCKDDTLQCQPTITCPDDTQRSPLNDEHSSSSTDAEASKGDTLQIQQITAGDDTQSNPLEAEHCAGSNEAEHCAGSNEAAEASTLQRQQIIDPQSTRLVVEQHASLPDAQASRAMLEQAAVSPPCGKKPSIKYFDPCEIPLNNKRGSWKQLPKLDIHRVRSLPTIAPAIDDARTNSAVSPKVRFHEVVIRSYDQTVGDNPAVSYGPPITLDWNFEDLEPIDVELYEANRGRRRGLRQMMMNYYVRKNLLQYRCGATEEEMKIATREANAIKRSRALTKALLPVQVVEEVVQSAARKTRRLTARRKPNQL